MNADVPTITLTSGGERVPATVLSVEVRRELNRVPEATVTARVVRDARDASVKTGYEVQGRSARPLAATFELGKPLAIAVRAGNDEDATLFEGLVAKYGMESRAGVSELRIELKDAAFRLTRQRRSAVFHDQTDADTIRELVEGAGLAVGQLAAAARHDEMIQFQASDWDFIVSRADAQGRVVDVRDGVVHVRPMALAGAAKQLDGVLEVELELDGGEQWATLTGQAWDAEALTATDPVAAARPAGALAAPDVASVAERLGGEAGALVHPVSLPELELNAWASSRLLRSRLALLRGRVLLEGRPDVAPLDAVELEGVGERLDGAAFVSAVTHTIDDGGWRTELRIGLPPEPFAHQPDIADVLAGGLLPPARGLHVGVVSAYEADADPLGQQRVKVLLSVLGREQDAVWARVARPDAGEARGLVFWPEPGDEVVVGFVNGDPRQAILLGALHGPGNAPPAVASPPTADAPGRRAIVSKRGTVLAFDDAGPSVTLKTPGGNRIVLDDAAQSIALTDPHGNSITLDAEGITLKSASDLKLDAAGQVVISGREVDVR
ncbi:MAG: type VI secretion system tip protein VgrG [Kofleriaceae bacterium]